jgi:hypothetical protein
MDEHDLQEIYRDIMEILEHFGLDWLIAEVNQHVAMEKIIEEKHPGYKEVLSETQDNVRTIKRGRLSSVTIAQPYNARERLELLLSAIEQALIQSASVSRAAADFFVEQSQKNPNLSPTVIFDASQPGDIETDDRERIMPSRDNVEAHQMAAETLQGIIDRVRREMRDVRAS